MSFSIITTVLNGEKFIADCIESVQKQKYSKSLEHIIVDGGSSDNTIAIVKKFSKEFKNIVLISKQNIGIYQGINIGIDKARNKFLHNKFFSLMLIGFENEIISTPLLSLKFILYLVSCVKLQL